MGDVGEMVINTLDGGYLVAGYAKSFGAGPGNDCWLLKLTSAGVVEWEKMYGDGSDSAHSICQTDDGYYVAAGHTSCGINAWDFLVFRLSPDGDINTSEGSTGIRPFEIINSKAVVIETFASALDTNVVPVDAKAYRRNARVAPVNADSAAFLVRPIKKKKGTAKR